MRRRLRIDRFRSPRSTEPMKVRCRSQRWARSACVQLRASRWLPEAKAQVSKEALVVEVHW